MTADPQAGNDLPRRLRVFVRGVVQGVGFRPFVARLAREYRLTGWVLNSTEGVTIEVEGANPEVFVSALEWQAPVAARILELRFEPLPPAGYADFSIHASDSSGSGDTLVSSDLALCADCAGELADPNNRRYGYPFTNCTNCGPRFTIVERVPYDRINTTMRSFAMCPVCQAEYDDLTDRRHHAQPNACPNCGPRAWYEEVGGVARREDWLEAVCQVLDGGQTVAIKGIGGFHLACDATNEAAVSLLRQCKRRGDKPFAIMVDSLASARKHCVISDAEAELLTSSAQPIVILKRRADCMLPAALAPANNTLGVMLPYSPLHRVLFNRRPTPLVMTSGNLADEPIVHDNDTARVLLAPLVTGFLLHDREIHTFCDDSVTAVAGGSENLVRRARGYAPLPVLMPHSSPHLLATGAVLKSTFSLASGRQVFVSQHLGDLENEETLTAYRAILHRYCELFAVTPAAVALDAHPDYLSSRFARQYAVEHSLAPSTVVEVQHHHAHIAACMADNGLSGQVIGVAFDGTGFGSDGTVWGGEFLLADYQGFSRVGWLRPFRLPGGDAAVVSPYRSAFALCDMAGIARQSVITLLQRHFPGFALTQSELMVVEKQLRGELPAPLCSSVGRLFDAVAVLSGACLRSDFEGQAAVALEQVSCQADEGEYELPIEQFGDHFVVNPNSLVRAVVSDAFGGVTADKIGARFHRALADAVVNGCLAMRKELDLQRVCLSGGVFQNQLLLKLTLPALAEAGFDVFIHHQVPCNDGGISLGQAAIAACRLGSTCTK